MNLKLAALFLSLLQVSNRCGGFSQFGRVFRFRFGLHTGPLHADLPTIIRQKAGSVSRRWLRPCENRPRRAGRASRRRDPRAPNQGTCRARSRPSGYHSAACTALAGSVPSTPR
jgi:hypothetical protein